jgi:DNA (cytosine-5)-methyltransferase 1
LFAGIGGFDLALERNGIEVVASVEWDKHAQSVLKNRFPNSQIYGDIQEVTGEQLINAGFDPRNGIITGGFPCQDLSVAGKRAGLAGNRSGLFWEICRLLDETKTQYFILENVPGLLSSSNGADMGTVISALAQRGYGLAYRVLDAQHFGVPQRRRRVFIVGSLGDNGGTPAEILSIAEGRSGYLAQGGKSRKSPTTAANGSPATVGTLLARDHKGIDQISVEENKLVLFDLPNDDKEQKNDALLFQATRNENIRIFEKHSPTLAVAGWLRSLSVFSPSNFANYSENDDVAATLRAGGGDLGGGSETLLVFDPHQTDGVRLQGKTTNTLRAAMGMGGNNVPMVAYPMHGAMVGRSDTAGPNGSGFLDENDPSYTLTASSQARHGVVVAFDTYNHTTAETNQTLRAGTDVDKQGAVLQNSMVRRLTPLECERLQGFPDHWTEGQTDGHRYKQLGNAVAVPVVQWIIERLVKVINEKEAQ